MSYTNTTTHFQWPLPEETDLFNGLDDNQMKEELDEKIYNLEQQSSGDHEAVTQLNTRVTEVEQTVGGYDAQIEQLEGTVSEHAERLVNLTNRQTELSRRLNGKAGESTIAPEYNEDEVYTVGDFVYHNNILYKAIAASATPAGEFDADKWDIAILTDELGGSTPGSIAAANVSFDDTVAQLGANNAQAAIVALKTLIDNMGGNTMPELDFDNPIYEFNSTHTSFTTTKECYLYGQLKDTNAAVVSVDGQPVSVQTASTSTAAVTAVVTPLKVGAGKTISITHSSGMVDAEATLSVYDVES